MKILVVDDEIDVKDIFEQYFEDYIEEGTFDFVFRNTAQDGIKYLEEHSDVKLVLADIRMPGMSGLDMLKEMKSLRPKLNVVMVSAYGDAANYETATKYGAVDFVNKPIDLSQLQKKIMEFSSSASS